MLKNFIKKYIFTFYLIIFIIFLTITNKIAKNFLHQSQMEKRTKPAFIEKVYGKENIEDYKKVITEQTVFLDYEPFVEFTEPPRENHFTNVSILGNRCNENGISNCLPPVGGNSEIWVFGGSTTFGYGVKNNETIPSYIQKKLENNFRVINFGVCYYFSTQERILFNNLLLNLPPPNAAVFIDGLNDLSRKYKYNETSYSQAIRYKFSKTSEDDITDYFKERFYRLNLVKLIKQFRLKKEVKISKEKLNKKNVNQLVEILINNQKMNKAIGKKFNIKVINVLQTVPIYEDSYSSSNLPKEYLQKLDSTINLKFGYEAYSLKKDKEILDFSKLKIKKPMFIDGVHYSPEFNRAIANLITKELLKD